MKCIWHKDKDHNNNIFYVPECKINYEIEHPEEIPEDNICTYCGKKIKEV
jgi:hypothetical protein